MTSFDNREKAEENKYAHDKELEFMVYARYHSLLADWATQKMQLDKGKTEEYKNSLVTLNLAHHDDEALLGRIKHDFLVHDVHMGEHDIREAMHNLLHEAKAQVGKKA